MVPCPGCPGIRREFTYPPELLPSPDKGDEVEIIVQKPLLES